MIKSVFFQTMLDRFQKWGETPEAKRVWKLAGLLFTITISLYLIYKLSLIGWAEVWRALPTTPWFYLLMLCIFFNLPFFQLLIYRVAWDKRVPAWRLFLILLNKRSLDKDVAGYSGEVYLFAWAQEHLDLPRKVILLTQKDIVILSSAAFTVVSFSLLVIFFSMGWIILPKNWVAPGFFQLLIMTVFIVIVAGLIVKLRKTLIFLPKPQALKIFSLHISRLLVVQLLQILQWAVVMPEVDWVSWFTLLATQIIVTCIPFLPNRDLIFFGAGLELSAPLNVSTPEMAGMLLTASVMSKVLNLFFFNISFLVTHKQNKPGVKKPPLPENVKSVVK